MQSFQVFFLASQRLWVACVVYGMIVLFEFILVVRRVSGGFQPTEFSAWLCWVLIPILLLALVSYGLLPERTRCRNNRWQIVFAIGTVLPVAVSTFVLIESLNASMMGGLFFLGIGIPVFLFFIDRSQAVLYSPQPKFSQTETTFEEAEQSIKRWTADDRTDCMEGFVTARFLPGQKHANVHVPFQPPFDSVPEVECYETTDTSSKIKLALVRTYGIRLEVQRLAEFDSSAIVKLQFEVAATPSQ